MNRSADTATRLAVALSLAAALALAPALAVAQSCTVSASGLSFGSYDTFDAVAAVATAQIDVACTSGLGWEVELDAGLHTSGSFTPRKLERSGVETLNYQLYKDAARTQIWGDGTGSTTTVTGTGSGLGSPDTLTVYGRIPALQNVGVGSYADTVTVTVLY